MNKDINIENLEPKNVFKYFNEICKIPHGSGDMNKISSYLVDFAKEHKLEYKQDEHNNVIIFKGASHGYEMHDAVIMQAHIDMVCDKTLESNHNFENDSIEAYVDGNYIKAKGTTLGADDGIGVAYLLAILDDNNLIHPSLEMIFTSDEEIGMIGAKHLDLSSLKGKYLINLDSEEEGIFYASCAGGVRVDVKIPICYENIKTNINTNEEAKDYSNDESNKIVLYDIEISGLKGGHSGCDIILKRANANKLFGRLLNELKNEVDYYLVNITSGSKDNVIANKGKVSICLAEDSKDIQKLENTVIKFKEQIIREYENIEDYIQIEIVKNNNETKSNQDIQKVISNDTRDKFIKLLLEADDGIIKMSEDIENLVQTSSNCGIIETNDEDIVVTFLLRSCVEDEKWASYEKLKNLSNEIKLQCSYHDDYPGWKYSKDSKLRDTMIKIYKEEYDNEPKVLAIHAGLECGIFADKLKDVDIMSYGPNLHDVHTYNERVEIDSVVRVWNFTVKLLENL